MDNHDPSPLGPFNMTKTAATTGVIDEAGRDADRTAPPLAVTPDEVLALIEARGPTMHYQPIVHLDSGIVIGAEAFSRFPSSAPVLDWFRCAENSGLGPQLEFRAVTNILDDRSRWPATWKMVCVNVSPERLSDEGVCSLLTARTDAQLVVELTSQSALPVDVLLRQRLEQLRDQGVRIAVSGATADDETRKRILRVRPEVVKLDRRLIDEIADDHDRQRFVGDMVQRCNQEGIFVVAVGIETTDQLGLAKSLGIEAAQGHLFGAASKLPDPY